MANHGPHDHAHGLKAHIAIGLNTGIDIDAAVTEILALKKLPHPKDPGGNFHLLELHVTLGEMDLIADVHCSWTTPQGRETHVIGEWVNAVRQLRAAGGEIVVSSTSTNVCMEWP